MSVRNEAAVPAAYPGAGYRLLVVGGCGGIGARLVQAARTLGLRVTVLDMAVSLREGACHEDVDYVACDVADVQDVARAFAEVERLGGCDGLAHLAGYTGERVALADMPPADWAASLNTNLLGTFHVARAAKPLLDAAAARGASPGVVLTSSTFGVRVPHVGYSAYAAAKAGVINLVRALATEWSPAIRVNGLAPGVVQTPFLDGGTGRPAKSTRLDMDRFVQGVPLQRLGQPEDMVGPILFLLGAAAGYLTGQTLHVNGGSWMQ